MDVDGPRLPLPSPLPATGGGGWDTVDGSEPRGTGVTWLLPGPQGRRRLRPPRAAPEHVAPAPASVIHLAPSSGRLELHVCPPGGVASQFRRQRRVRGQKAPA